MLARCYQNCLALAREYGIRTIAFPAISTGVYRFPVDLASQIATKEVAEFLKNDLPVENVDFVCFNDLTYNSYLSRSASISGEI
jgi:O-acetyl-ADP-ribose deacetylase (regulator of RNase III)